MNSRKRLANMPFAVALVMVIVLASMLAVGCSSDDDTDTAAKAEASQVAVDEALQTVVETGAIVAAADTGASSDDGMNTGIQVHGRWTIDVLDPDGTLASHTEFENGLTDDGKELLQSLLSGVSGNVTAQQMGTWAIQLSSSGSGTFPFQDNDSPATYANIIDASATNVSTAYPNYFKNLTVSCMGDPDYELVLQGYATAQYGGTIMAAGTIANVCDAASAVPCTAWATQFAFTSKTLDTPVDVLAGQSIMAKVVLSFS